MSCVIYLVMHYLVSQSVYLFYLQCVFTYLNFSLILTVSDIDVHMCSVTNLVYMWVCLSHVHP